VLRADCLIPMFLCCSVFLGCSEAGPERLPTVPAGGMVMLEGDLVGEATLDFIPTAAGTEICSATAQVAADGTFTVTTYDEGDGIVVGSYNVKVTFPIENASPPNIAPFELTIAAGGDADLLINLTPQKGTKGTLMSPELDSGGAGTNL
jgi:hypothetical protein